MHFAAYIATDVTARLYCEYHVSCVALGTPIWCLYEYVIGFVCRGLLVNASVTLAQCHCVSLGHSHSLSVLLSSSH